MKTICKHTYPADLCGICNPPAKEKNEVHRLREALRMLYDAADVYAADQSGVTDERCGLVQPITAEEGRALNEALVVAAKILHNA